MNEIILKKKTGPKKKAQPNVSLPKPYITEEMYRAFYTKLDLIHLSVSDGLRAAIEIWVKS
jgi:hypothetical protein